MTHAAFCAHIATTLPQSGVGVASEAGYSKLSQVFFCLFGGRSSARSIKLQWPIGDSHRAGGVPPQSAQSKSRDLNLRRAFPFLRTGHRVHIRTMWAHKATRREV
eukprot:scaffold11543_cov128-Isochrysis_galbana.AAC.3